MPLIQALLKINQTMKQKTATMVLVASSLAIFASALVIMIIALTRYSDMSYVNVILSSGWPVLLAAGVGPAIAYLLASRSEKRKEMNAAKIVKYAIKYELNNYYEVLNYGLEIGKVRSDRADTLGVNQNSDLVDKWRKLDNQSLVYDSIDSDNKLRTLDVELRARLDQIYAEIRMHGIHMYFQQTSTEVYFAISKTDAENLKEVISDVIELLD